MKLLDRILNPLWPWSALRRLRHDLDLQRSIYHDYRDWSERFYSLVRRTLSSPQFTALLTQWHREAEAECVAIGEVAHAAQSYIAPFPPTSPLTGDYYTHVIAAHKAAEAARARQPEAHKAFDEMAAKWENNGGIFSLSNNDSEEGLD